MSIQNTSISYFEGVLKRYLLEARLSVLTKFRNVLITAGFVVLCCYIYEQLFYEIGIGQLRTYYRAWEGVVILIGVAICFGWPMKKWFQKRLDRRYRLFFMAGHGGAIVFVGLISFTNTCFALGKPLYQPATLGKADAIIICDMGNFYLRSFYAAQLYHQGLSDKVVSFGANRQPFTGFLQEQLNIPLDHVIQARPRGAFNTVREVALIKELVERKGWERIMLVIDPFAMSRVKMALKKVGIHDVLAAPIPQSVYELYPLYFLGVVGHPNQKTMAFSELDFAAKFVYRHKMTMAIFHEYLGLVFYWMMGHV